MIWKYLWFLLMAKSPVLLKLLWLVASIHCWNGKFQLERLVKMNISFFFLSKITSDSWSRTLLKSAISISSVYTWNTHTQIYKQTHTNTHTHTPPKQCMPWNLSIRIWQHLNDTYKGYLPHVSGFRGSSAGKEFAYNTGDPGSIPRSGRSPGKGIHHPLQYSWASLVAQTVKNLPAMQETWVWSLGWEDPLEEVIATHSSILAWRIPMDRGAWWARVHGVTKSWAWLTK